MENGIPQKDNINPNSDVRNEKFSNKDGTNYYNPNQLERTSNTPTIAELNPKLNIGDRSYKNPTTYEVNKNPNMVDKQYKNQNMIEINKNPDKEEPEIIPIYQKKRVENKCFDWTCFYFSPYLFLPISTFLVIISRYPTYNYLSGWSLFYIICGFGLTIINLLACWTILQSFLGCLELFLAIPIIITTIVSFVFYMLSKPIDDYPVYNGISILMFDFYVILSSLKLFRRPCCLKPQINNEYEEVSEPLSRCCPKCPGFIFTTTRCGEEMVELMQVCGCCCGGYFAEGIPDENFYHFIGCNWFWDCCWQVCKWIAMMIAACVACFYTWMCVLLTAPRRREVIYV